MARMTKKLISKIWDWTNNCYRKALIEVYNDFFSDEEIKTLNHKEMKIRLDIALKPIRTPEISNAYIKYLFLDLNSDQLSLIVKAHKLGKAKRSEIVIDAIMNELFERSVKEQDEQN